MWNHWEMFYKMTWIMIYLGVQNDPEIGPLAPIFNTALKVALIDMYTKTDAQPVGIFWENDQRPEFSLIWGPKVAQKLGLWGPYSPHIYKYLQWACEAILLWNQWKLFEKVTKHQKFFLLWAQNGPEIGSLRPIFYTSLKVAPMRI